MPKQFFYDDDPFTQPSTQHLCRSNIFLPQISTRDVSRLDIRVKSESSTSNIFFSDRENSAHMRRHNSCMFVFSKRDRSVCLSGRHSEYFLHVKKNHDSAKYSGNVNLRSHMCSETASKYLAKMMRYRSHKKAKANTCCAVMNSQVANSTAKWTTATISNNNLFRCLLTHGHVSFVRIIPISDPIISPPRAGSRSVHSKQIKRQFQKKMFCKWNLIKSGLKLIKWRPFQFVCQLQYFRSPISHKLAVDRKYPFHFTLNREANKVGSERICFHSIIPKTFRTIEFE